MTVELIVMSMLNIPAVTNLVGDNYAVQELVQPAQYPGIVVTPLDDIPRPNVDYTNGPQQALARVQLNPCAVDPGQLAQLAQAIRIALDFKHHVTHAGHLVVSSRLALTSGVQREPVTGMWTRAIDYLVRYYE